MQRHEVRLRGAESWGGGGWGQTARYEPSGGVVPSQPTPLYRDPSNTDASPIRGAAKERQRRSASDRRDERSTRPS